MNRRQFFIAVAALAVLAVLGAAVVLSDRSAWTAADSRAGQKAIPGLRLSEVAEIAILDPAGELHLARGETGWSVRERAGFAAETDRIAALLVKLAELKIVQSEPLPESQRARLELLEPKDKAAGGGTLIELKDAKGGSLGRLLLGKKIVKSSPVASLSRGETEATGRYLTAGGEAGTMLAVGEPLTEVESKPELWLVKDLLRADGAKSISSSKDGRQRWSVTRETESADWKFAGSKEKPDLQKATDLASSLGWVNLVDVIADPAKADTGLDHAIVIKADTFDGISYTLTVGNKAGDNYYVRVAVAGEPRKTRTPAKGEKAEDTAKNDNEFEERRKKLIENVEREKKLERWTYLVAKNGLEPLLRDRPELMPEKKKSAKKT
ncbi:MAG TPA: DUF4340 domain-containing protein [Burkholderiales bacterium]|nr:DUF4340 domain-containing protein [Burkholderiales bacterium]